MRDRDAGERGGRHRAGHAGDDLEGDARPCARQGLLAATAEHEGVAALQPDDREARERSLDQKPVDLLLWERRPPRFLARVDAFRVRGGEVEKLG